ncbi:hypothetical protein D9Q98_000533 [Chlorella vulgaris]|uniref:FAD-binding FR-type domain-containing protein n=1 Tax=Chlorella vulgaris TaxID=3077 RepID=A0A9D4TZE4_CHLVU|nr:hypothetical protein D9Q98_000533 [Chlorella vulgaris]
MAPEAVFHAGQLEAQRRVGVSHTDAGNYIRPFMPDQHRAFYSSLLNLLYIGGVDDQDRVWASVAVGQPGFITSKNVSHLAIAPHARLPSDPLQLAAGSPLGALGLDLATRRRNKVNGTVASLDGDGGLEVHCEQTVGNCPKYIQTRQVQLDPARLAKLQRGETGAGVLDSSGPLGKEQLDLIRKADTFFLATCGAKQPAAAAAGGPPSGQPHAGCDINHRGGPPGFVECSEDGTTLRWPDYVGNNFFMSFGNLQSNPAAGLLFVDFLTGDVLQLTGSAEVLYDDHSMPGAQRAVRFKLASWHYAPAALPILPAPVIQHSPYNPRLLGGSAALTDVQCVAVTQEAQGIKSFHFASPPGFQYAVGQFASFDFEVGVGPHRPEATRILNRTWTLSKHPAAAAKDGTFTISVKRAGVVSSFLHDSLQPGMSLQLRGVGGDFTVQDTGGRPALLLAGGIGITPLRAMFHELVRRGVPTTLLYSVRSPAEAAFLPELTSLAQQASADAAAAAGGGSATPAYRVIATASGGGSKGVDGWRSGRITGALVQEAVGSPAGCEVYMCGPVAFMDALEGVLQELGVDPARIHTESFAF